MSTEHTVKAGETLSLIAKRYLGNAGRYKEIATLNQIDNPDKIYVGQVLKIPSDSLQESKQQKQDPQPEASETQPTRSVTAEGESLVSLEELKTIFHKAKDKDVEQYCDAINECLRINEINTPLRIAHFLAQIAHESGCLHYTQENLNYSAKALRSVFGKYFPTDEEAEQFARKPEAIANRVYASRMGNGDEASGEGWRYRGRGFIQLTGKHNYESISRDTGVDLVNNPDLCATDPKWIVETAGWYWSKHRLNAKADQDDLKGVTRAINGGYNGLSDREAYLNLAKSTLNIQKAA